MMAGTFNVLDEALIRTEPCGRLTLPGLLGALARDEVDSFPALRPHQEPLWHMFLVQLAALAVHRTQEHQLPERDVSWAAALRMLTKEFPGDEPWCLVVNDRSKPAFLQPPVPDGLELKNRALSADALDLLITSKNHDLKKNVAYDGDLDDWLLALVSLQTGEGFSGRDNYGIARMNGGSSSRPLLGLAPLPGNDGRMVMPRPGAWFRRDVQILLERRQDSLATSPYLASGIGLTWVVPWQEGTQLQMHELDIWFIEVCRRARLAYLDGRLCALLGTSKGTRISAKDLKGVVGDPWAPVHKTENKSFTLSEGDFDYRTLIDLLLSGDWQVPLLATPGSFESPSSALTIMAMALARGNSKTYGYKARCIPISGKIADDLRSRRKELHQLAKEQAEVIAAFDKALRQSIALVAARGERSRVKPEHYQFANEASGHLDRFADSIFFGHLWQWVYAQQQGKQALEAERTALERRLWQCARDLFEQYVCSVPCASIFRPRAETRGRSALRNIVRQKYPELFEEPGVKEEVDDAA